MKLETAGFSLRGVCVNPSHKGFSENIVPPGEFRSERRTRRVCKEAKVFANMSADEVKKTLYL